MRPTRILHLAGYAAGAAVVVYAIEYLLVHTGAGMIIPPGAIAIVLVVLGLLVLALAWPVRASRQHRLDPDLRQEQRESAGDPQRQRRLVDPFYAVRVVVAARAASRTGAVLFGGTAGLLVLIVFPPTVFLGAVLGRILVVAGAALVLAVCGYVAELFCKLPPPPAPPEGGIGPTPSRPAAGPLG
jgi:hypothetical protein